MAQEKVQPEGTPPPVTLPMQNPEKPPEEWATGKEPMTGPQLYLDQISARALRQSGGRRHPSASTSRNEPAALGDGLPK